MIKKILNFSIERPKAIVTITLLVVILALIQFPRIKVDTDPENMLPETAFAKLCWVLANFDSTDEQIKILTSNIAGEILEREPDNGYQIYQGIEF